MLYLYRREGQLYVFIEGLGSMFSRRQGQSILRGTRASHELEQDRFKYEG